jgi:hypothetical protein
MLALPFLAGGWGCSSASSVRRFLLLLALLILPAALSCCCVLGSPAAAAGVTAPSPEEALQRLLGWGKTLLAITAVNAANDAALLPIAHAQVYQGICVLLVPLAGRAVTRLLGNQTPILLVLFIPYPNSLHVARQKCSQVAECKLSSKSSAMQSGVEQHGQHVRRSSKGVAGLLISSCVSIHAQVNRCHFLAPPNRAQETGKPVSFAMHTQVGRPFVC